jgi:hypothetical protein
MVDELSMGWRYVSKETVYGYMYSNLVDSGDVLGPGYKVANQVQKVPSLSLTGCCASLAGYLEIHYALYSYLSPYS